MDRLTGGGREKSRPAFSVLMIFIFTILLAVVALAGSVVGVKGFTLDLLPQVLTKQGHELLIYTVWEVRVPRVVLGMLIGMGLAVAGCLIQGITRNPLSDPEIMGINQGASLFVAAALLLFAAQDVTAVILLASFLGAAVGGSVVYLLSLHGEYTSTRLILAGIAVSLYMGSMTTGLIVMNETQLLDILYWMAGKLSGANWGDVQMALLGLLPAVIAACFFANPFNILALGEEVARGLGQNIVRVRRLAALLIVLLVGTAVALAGPIGFVGLMVPHTARALVGNDYRWVIPLSGLMGALLLVLADLLGQWVLYPAETPVGIVTALLGTPFFLYLMRKKGAVL